MKVLSSRAFPLSILLLTSFFIIEVYAASDSSRLNNYREGSFSLIQQGSQDQQRYNRKHRHLDRVSKLYQRVLKTQQTDTATLKVGENKVNYISENELISALVYIPEDYKPGEKRPAIVFIRPASGVKEQTIGLYAKLLSDRGFVTLAFDPRGFGESTGVTRQLENPYAIGEDAHNSISYLRTIPEVDADNIFAVGICMGSSYVTYVTAVDPRVNAMAMISPILNGRDFFIMSAGEGDFRTSEMFMALGPARQAASTGTPIMAPIIFTEGPQAEMPFMAQMAGYYMNADLQTQGYADHTNWRNEMNALGNQYILSFSPMDYLELLTTVPAYMAIGSVENMNHPGAIEYFEQMQGPKELREIEAGHFDLYWMPEHTTPISDDIDTFFRNYMK